MAIELQYFGIAFFQIKTEDGRTIVIDPCITLNPDCPVTVEDVKASDVVLVSHAARDHIGDTVAIMEGNKGTLLSPRNVRTYVTMKGLTTPHVETMIPGVERKVVGVMIKAFQTVHGGYIQCDGQYLSDISLAYMLYLRPDLKILHMGDTALFSDMKMIGEIYRPDVVLIPIGKFHLGATELNPYEAALAISWLKAQIAIPMHFDPKTQADSPAEFANHVKEMSPGAKVIPLEPGGVLTL